MPAKIIINRKSEWLNRMRGFKVFIDGKEAGIVNNGSSEEFTVESGVHIITMKFGFYSGQPKTISLNDNETKFLQTRRAWKFFWFFYILFLLGLLSGFIFRSLNIQETRLTSIAGGILIAPAFFSALYHLTLGRKKYLLLEDDDSNIFNS